MKIAHISDLHFTTFFKKNNLEKIKHLLNYALAYKIDHIVISGDLTHNSEIEAFEILRKIFKDFGLLNSERLSLVIGNHDIFGGPQTAEDVFLFPDRCKLLDYDKKIKEFGDFFSEAFDYKVSPSTNSYFPYLKKFNDVSVIGLNSIAKYSKLNNPFASNGKIYKNEYNFLVNVLNSCYIEPAKKLIILHHHFNKIKVDKNKSASSLWQNIEKQTMRLKKKKRLFQLFRMYKVDLVLHGHIHENNEYIRKGVRFINAGASLLGPIDDELKINFVNVQHSKINIETHRIIHNTSSIIYNRDEPKLFSIIK